MNSYGKRNGLVVHLLRTVQKTVSAEQDMMNIIRSLNAASKGVLEGKYKIKNLLWAVDISVEEIEANKGGNAKELVCGAPCLKSVYVGGVGMFSIHWEFFLCFQSTWDSKQIIKHEKNIVTM